MKCNLVLKKKLFILQPQFNALLEQYSYIFQNPKYHKAEKEKLPGPVLVYFEHFFLSFIAYHYISKAYLILFKAVNRMD